MPQARAVADSGPAPAVEPEPVAAADSLAAVLRAIGQFENVLDCLHDALVYVKDGQGRYLWVNRTLLQRGGLAQRACAVGLSAPQIFELDAELTLAQERALFQRRHPVLDELTMYRGAGGRRFWCMSSKFPLLDEDGATVVGLVGTCRDLPRAEVRHAAYQRLRRFLDYLDEHLNGGSLITEAASNAGISLDALERLSKEVFHLTPQQILMKRRLDRACRLLTGPGISITDIAAECGYADHSAFTRQFKAATRMTPSQFRSDALRTGRCRAQHP
ncbi:MAG: helix-turn-helix domain-containing protein [Burkholderiaceae bacterium]